MIETLEAQQQEGWDVSVGSYTAVLQPVEGDRWGWSVRHVRGVLNWTSLGIGLEQIRSAAVEFIRNTLEAVNHAHAREVLAAITELEGDGREAP